MIIVDFSQLCTAAYATHATHNPELQDDIDTFRHRVLNSLRYNNCLYREFYGDMVLAIDAQRSWRYQVFPYYKAQRKEQKVKSAIDWATLKKFTNQLATEVTQFLPYKVVQAAGAEGDDIVAVLTRRNVSNLHPTLIVSSDKDFIQLQSRVPTDMVRQWDAIHEKWVTHANPARYLFEHVIKGDRGDGIPNIFCDDDHYVAKKGKAKPITQKLLDQIWEQGPAAIVPYSGFRRNINLIDLSKTPAEIQQAIVSSYESEQTKDRRQLLSYLIRTNLKQLAERIGDF